MCTGVCVDLDNVGLGLRGVKTLRVGGRPVYREGGGDVEGNHLTTRKIEESCSGGNRWRAEADVTVKVMHQCYGVIA